MSLSESQQKLLAQRLAGKGRTRPSAVSRIPPRPEAADDHIAPGQRSLWFQSQVEPDSPNYTITSSYRVLGQLDQTLVERAANVVIERHAILRSTFVAVDETATLRTSTDFRLHLERVRTAVDALKNVAQQEARKPFDLETVPAIRMVYVSSESSDDGILMLLVHHSIFDEWSAGVFWKEFLAAYDERVLEPLPVQYVDVAYWQRQQQEAGKWEPQLDYWRRQLVDLPDPLALPSDHQRTLRTSTKGALKTRRLDARTSEAIKGLATQSGTSPFMVCLLGFQLLLHRYTGGEDIVVGTPVANRKLPELAHLIGYFLTSVAVRNKISPEGTVADALTQIRETVLAAFDNLDVPFDQIVDAIRPVRVPGQHPVFQVMFVYEREETALAKFQLGDATLESTFIDTAAAKFDITLFIVERGDTMEATIEYRSDLFEATTIDRMLGHLHQIFLAMTASPSASPSASASASAKISEIDLLSSDERRQLLHEWQGAPLETSELVPDVIVRHAVEAPTSIAVIDGTQRLTYAELTLRASALATELAGQSIGSGEPVCLYLSRTADAIVGIMGIHLAGAAYVPVDPSYPAERQQHMILDSGARVAVTLTSHRAELDAYSVDALCLDSIESSASHFASKAQRDATAYMIYTSGSTGVPKGVIISQENLASSTAARQAFYAKRPERFLLIPGLSFDSSIAGIFWTLAAGGSLVIMPDKLEQDIDALADLIASEKVTHILCLPSLYDLLLQYASTDKLQSLTTVMVAGEACPPRLLERHASTLANTSLFNEYGPTEATVWCIAQQLNETAGSSVPIGKPIPGTRIYLMDNERQLVPPGVPGEIYIGGPGVASGYHQRPELTETHFITDPFSNDGSRLYRTGDLARFQSDGSLIFLGRVDNQIKIRGHRIELGEIEAALREDPSIEDAAVIVQSDVTISTLYDRIQELDPSETERILSSL